MKLDLSALRPTRAEIDLDRLGRNIDAIRSILPEGTSIMPVVKADAYGHGALECVSVAQSRGIDHFAVATLEEAMELRNGGVSAQILILGPLLPEQFAVGLALDITFTMIDANFVRSLASVAQREGRIARVHVKVDTGMSRVGFPWTEAVDEILSVSRLPGIEVQGIFSHFASADASDKSYAKLQFNRFVDIIEELEAGGMSFIVKHCSNSGTILDMSEMALDMVRPGIILYGLYPSDEVTRPIDLLPVMRWTTRVTRIHDWPPGTPVSYGCSYVTKGQETLVTLPVGYADGYSRILSNQAAVLIRGQRCDIVGRVCMDMCIVRLPSVIARDVAIGDEVVLMGHQGHDAISASELARLMGTIDYEVVCMVGKRVPRVFYNEGMMVGARTLGT